MKPQTFFNDDDFQTILVSLLCRDLRTLRSCAHLLKSQDFQPLPGQKNGRSRWLIAELALDYFQRYGEPIGNLLKSELLAYTQKLHTPDRHAQDAVTFATQIQKAKLVGIEAIISRVAAFKRERLKMKAVEDLIQAQSEGALTDEKWMEITHQATSTLKGELSGIDYFSDEELKRRMLKRSLAQHSNRVPYLLIPPFDAMVRSIGPGHFGVAIAPPKRGKSLFLEWVGLAYTIQRRKVLYFTLEDPMSEVEDRFDAAVSNLPFHRLSEMPRRFRSKFTQFQRLARSRLQLFDGTNGDVTVMRMEQVYLHYRDRGFSADAIIVDYDDEIIPATARKERRFEFADIYRDLRRLAGKYQLIVWTAAQTQRGTEKLKILSGDKIAEDISKIRKATMAVGLGQGEWGDESVYLWVTAHKFDRQHVGCNIMADRSRMLIYDHDKTALKLQEQREHRQEPQ